MSELKCCVIDDEPLAAKLIAGYVSQTPGLTLEGVYNSAHEGIRTLLAGEIDLLFIDIQMPQLSGLELVKLIPARTMVVFVTAYPNYAIEGLRANAVDYLMKPVSYPEFLEAVARATERRNGAAAHPEAPSDPAAGIPAHVDPTNTHIIVKTEYRMRQIAKADILFVEGLKDYVRIYVEGESKSVITLLSMKGVEQALEPFGFMRVHRSYVINLSRIHTIERNRLLLIDRALSAGGEPQLHEVPVGDSYRGALAGYINSISINC